MMPADFFQRLVNDEEVSQAFNSKALANLVRDRINRERPSQQRIWCWLIDSITDCQRLQLTQLTLPHTSPLSSPKPLSLFVSTRGFAMRHIVILPYFCEEEVQRYLKIIDHIGRYPKAECDWQFLLAASPRIDPSETLKAACEKIAPTESFQCPTQIFGYPEGPTAMFWDAMEFIEQNSPNDGGFGLWLESDMAPVKQDWIDQLDAEWREGEAPILMGCYVPEVYKHRLLRKKKLLLEDHVNGGACYAKHFASAMPDKAREGVFDVVVYKYAKACGRVKATELINFSTNGRVRRDVLNPHKVLLHGFMQEKDQFIEDCIRPVTDKERRAAVMNPVWDAVDNTRRRARVWMVRRGKQAMYENMLLAKERNKGRRAA